MNADEVFSFNDKPQASRAMGHAVACGLSLNELCQITFTPLLKSDSYYCADPKSKAKRSSGNKTIPIAGGTIRIAGFGVSDLVTESTGSFNLRTPLQHGPATLDRGSEVQIHDAARDQAHKAGGVGFNILRCLACFDADDLAGSWIERAS